MRGQGREALDGETKGGGGGRDWNDEDDEEEEDSSNDEDGDEEVENDDDDGSIVDVFGPSPSPSPGTAADVCNNPTSLCKILALLVPLPLLGKRLELRRKGKLSAGTVLTTVLLLVVAVVAVVLWLIEGCWLWSWVL